MYSATNPLASLPGLLRLTAKAREAFEQLRNFTKPTSYRVERCDEAGEYRWKVVAAGSQGQ